jgi:hypothetical protein
VKVGLALELVKLQLDVGLVNLVLVVDLVKLVLVVDLVKLVLVVELVKFDLSLVQVMTGQHFLFPLQVSSANNYNTLTTSQLVQV